ncbi:MULTISPECIES: 5-guanidino-2-oxopentanoate decarboxylase [unclassified Modicisalibacter]|uniref:5-guanidino-2-oxopentanoate decarboxylase n=1 Tax=unclassified Modicisalibacter TaxID=2679913 RepID=UPI001CC91565|nr:MULTISPECIES: 5-guanidino-2-oxopentanoate decarboxylase [unclassified Modicisalibacter]MBZ9557281.1 5-guanidino-2-oxopentanoate decarboxylase [Modicisalibacter sp. R2A 31.J]MBZ9574005.1 5-guanidino-2-oxopentanoate decarboxylase [Modicisalibacter sp. MOD 31.J]
MTRGSRYLIDLLDAHGIDTVFGIPGVHTVELYRDLAGSRLRHVTPRHEQGAGFMADGYARATGRPAACFIISGPGMTNIATAMAQALADSVPMLVISSVNRRDTLGRGQGRLHELPDQRGTLAGVSVFSHTLQAIDALPEVLARAFAIFASARPGPVHIEIPLDVMTQPAPDDARPGVTDVFPPAAPDAALAWAADWLAAAERPLVLLGGGCADAAEPVRALVERLDAPALTTINAKGVLGLAHPLDLGACASLPAGRELARDADVILALGTELGETDYDLVFDGGFRLTGRLIRVDIDPQQLARNQAADLALLADVGELARDLLVRLPATATRGGAERVARVRAALALREADDVAPYAGLLDTLRDALPEATLVGDSTGAVYAGNFLVEMPAPRRWFNAATGYGTLGYGLPAALGAALGVPERPVVALVGDGGLMFTLGELATARDAGVPLVVVIWNNQGYGEIRRYMDANAVARLGVDLPAPDFVGLAEAFGCHGRHVGSTGALREALILASRCDRPTLIEIDADDWRTA